MMRGKKSGFSAPKPTVWTPSKLLQHLAINIEPMDCELPLSSPSSDSFLSYQIMQTSAWWQRLFKVPRSRATLTVFKTLNLQFFWKKGRRNPLARFGWTHKELSAQKMLLVHRHTAVPRRKGPPETPRRQELRWFKGHDHRSPYPISYSECGTPSSTLTTPDSLSSDCAWNCLYGKSFAHIFSKHSFIRWPANLHRWC